MENIRNIAISLLLRIFVICCALLILVVYLAFSQPGSVFLILAMIMLSLILLALALLIAIKLLNKKNCPSCHRPIASNTDFCPFCGIQVKPSSVQHLSLETDPSLMTPALSRMQTIPMPMLRNECPRCHEKISLGERFCGHCGLPLIEPN